MLSSTITKACYSSAADRACHSSAAAFAFSHSPALHFYQTDKTWQDCFLPRHLLRPSLDEMASLQDLIRNQPHLWAEARATANGIRDDGGIIFAEDPRFGEWLRASPLTIYQASMLENHALNTIRVGSTFANAIRDGTAFCGIPRAQLPPSVVTGPLVTQAMHISNKG